MRLYVAVYENAKTKTSRRVKYAAYSIWLAAQHAADHVREGENVASVHDCSSEVVVVGDKGR